ncbi:penicillin acylase family protein [Novosphingobium tardum]|uniref:Penicillin acylase family protein n=1 Tax=Novosphingobium tardum TaxID=1538021 RepID=A0ABV8RPQ8_9SPHN
MARRWGARLGWGMLALVLISLIALMTWEPLMARPGIAPPARPYKVEITRDEFGVPHVHGKSDADVAFGIAWAHAEDDFFTLQDVVAMTRGRYGAIAGADGAKIDFAFHLLDARGTVDRHYAALPADVKALLDGYASGLNLYAARHPAEIKLARLFPVNGRDIAAGFALRQPFFFGLDRTIGALVEGKSVPLDPGPALDGRPLPDYRHGGGDIISTPTVRPAPLPIGEDGALAGSNAFAISPRRADDGITRLVSNSHQPWWGGVAWYEIVVQSDQGWHMAGALFPGMPFLALGHNETLGWTNTVNRPDLVDVYKLVLNGDGTKYRLDGSWRPLGRERVWLPVRFGPFVLPIPKEVWRSAHGPAIVNSRGAFAFRYGGIDSIASVGDYYHLNKARDFAEWQQIMARHPLPSTNFLYADRAGNIAYLYNAAFPKRKPGFDWRRVLPGDRSDLIWREAVAPDQIPHYLNPASGYLYNSNNTPFLAAGPGSDLDPSATSALLGVELDETNRSRRAGKLLAATNPIGRRELYAIKFDTGYERTGYVAWMLDAIAALDLRRTPDLAAGQKLLAQWDYTADGRGPADALAVMVLEEAMSRSYNHRPPPDPQFELAKAVHHLQRHFGRIDPPLGAVIRLRQGKVDLPMDGGGDTLRAATSWIKTSPDGRLPIKHGDSFVMMIEWPKGGAVSSQSIQPFGAATTRPASPHYADQAPLFVAHRFKPVHFTPADIAAHAVSRETVTAP